MELENWANCKNLFNKKSLKKQKAWQIRYCQEVKKYTNYKMFYRDNRIVKKREKGKCEIFSYKKAIKIFQKSIGSKKK